MRISKSGNVGIGTTNPETQLHIKSDVDTFSTDTPSKGIHMGCTYGGYDYDILINGGARLFSIRAKIWICRTKLYVKRWDLL